MQHIHQIAALLLGVAERQRADRAVMLEQCSDGLQTFLVFYLVETLAYLAALMLLRQLDLLRLAHELVCQARDTFRVSGGEQHRLAISRALLHHE